MAEHLFETQSRSAGWRWAPKRLAGGTAAVAIAAAIVGQATIGVGTAQSATFTDLVQSAATAAGVGQSGQEFSVWNTTRNVLRTELNHSMGPSAAHKAGTNGAGIDVALIDTGVAPVHGVNTADALVNGPDLSLDRQAGRPASVDGFGHGTHLAGIIAGRDAGVAPASRIVNMKVGASDGAVDVSQVIASIDWVVTHRKDPGMNIRVINLAYGTDSTQAYTSSPLTHAVESAWRNGIVVVVSAGNTGAALTNPATDPFVLTVGAVDTNDPANLADDKLAPFSSVGTSSRGVDLLAPGVSLTSLRVKGGMVDTLFPESKTLFDVYTKGSGTSQSAAWVSGAVALLLQRQPNLTPDQVKAILKSTARPLAGVAANAQGSGVIDVTKALAAAPSTDATQKFTKSTGKGKIEAARGTSHVLSDSGAQLTGEYDIMGQPWSGSVWAPKSTAATAWTGGTWNGSVWAGDTFESNLTVDGVSWAARTWRSVVWTARTWRADLWAARTWRSEEWAARTWRSDGWV